MRVRLSRMNAQMVIDLKEQPPLSVSQMGHTRLILQHVLKVSKLLTRLSLHPIL